MQPTMTVIDSKYCELTASGSFCIALETLLISHVFQHTTTMPQFTMEQCNFLAFEYHQRKGGKRISNPGWWLILWSVSLKPDVLVKIILLWFGKKQIAKGTVNNCNSKSSKSPGPTNSGHRRTRRDNATLARAKAVMDRDGVKQIGERDVSPVSTARRTVLGIPKSSWSRVVKELLRYHPYKPIARH